MLFDFAGGGVEQEYAFSPAPSTVTPVRDLGLKSCEAGLWSIPEISSEVPPIFELEGVVAKLAAEASITLHRCGLRIPEGPFTTLDAALAAQLVNLTSTKSVSPDNQLPLHISAHIDSSPGRPHRLVIRGQPERGLSLFKLKADVERMNQEMPGLGWRLTAALANCARYGLQTFEPCYLGYIAEFQLFYGASNDRDFAEEALGGPASEEEVNEFLAASFCTVARFVEVFGGHGHLVNLGEPASRPGRVPGKAAIRKADLSDKTVKMLHAISRFERCGERARACLAEFVQEPEENDEDIYAEAPIQIGALAFVVWQDLEMIGEMVEHYEQGVYESGNADELLFAYVLDLDRPETWPKFVEGYKSLLACYAALCDLLSLLPRED